MLCRPCVHITECPNRPYYYLRRPSASTPEVRYQYPSCQPSITTLLPRMYVGILCTYDIYTYIWTALQVDGVDALWHVAFTCQIWSIHIRDIPSHMCYITDTHVRHGAYTCMTKLIHTCDKTHPCVWHDSFACVMLHLQLPGTMHSHVWYDTFTFVTWCLHTCDVTRPHVWHDSFTRVTWHIHMRDMTHSQVWHDSSIHVIWRILTFDDTFMCVTWLIHICGTTRSHVWNDLFIRVTWIIHIYDMIHPHVCHATFTHETRRLNMCDLTHSYIWHNTFTRLMTHSRAWHDSSTRVAWLKNSPQGLLCPRSLPAFVHLPCLVLLCLPNLYIANRQLPDRICARSLGTIPLPSFCHRCSLCVQSWLLYRCTRRLGVWVCVCLPRRSSRLNHSRRRVLIFMCVYVFLCTYGCVCVCVWVCDCFTRCRHVLVDVSVIRSANRVCILL